MPDTNIEPIDVNDDTEPALFRKVARLANEVNRRLYEIWLSTQRGRYPARRALDWIRMHELLGGGIRVHSGHPSAYAEVTGYIVPTLLNCNEPAMAARLVRWLLRVQMAAGSFREPDQGLAYVFDTGQALRGLLAARMIIPDALVAASRAGDYLLGQMVDFGRGGFGNRYQGEIPESIHLYVLPPLLQASAVLGRPDYQQAAENCLEYYLQRTDSLAPDTLTHYLAYELEALIELGRLETAREVLATLREAQDSDGAVRAMPQVEWVCTPGLAQLAVCWYKVGEYAAADKALMWLERHQRRSGGFLGSYGPGAAYHPDVEVSWAVKFFLDACRLREYSQTTHNSDTG